MSDLIRNPNPHSWGLAVVHDWQYRPCCKLAHRGTWKDYLSYCPTTEQLMWKVPRLEDLCNVLSTSSSFRSEMSCPFLFMSLSRSRLVQLRARTIVCQQYGEAPTRRLVKGGSCRDAPTASPLERSGSALDCLSNVLMDRSSRPRIAHNVYSVRGSW